MKSGALVSPPNLYPPWSGEVSTAFFNTPSDTHFYLSVEHQAFMEEKGNRKREEDLRLRPST